MQHLPQALSTFTSACQKWGKNCLIDEYSFSGPHNHENMVFHLNLTNKFHEFVQCYLDII